MYLSFYGLNWPKDAHKHVTKNKSLLVGPEFVLRALLCSVGLSVCCRPCMCSVLGLSCFTFTLAVNLVHVSTECQAVVCPDSSLVLNISRR